ncbi:MAG: iron chaperone [Candidatus Eiseniibacteriota bacterium]
MFDSKARTVTEYLASLPAERRAVVSKVRDVVRRNLPKGYVETIGWGMINYEVPLARFSDTHNGRPLCYAGLAAQKNHYGLYLMGLYVDSRRTEWFAGEFKKAGKKLDMGKSCVRFRSLEDPPLDVIGKAIASARVRSAKARTRS